MKPKTPKVVDFSTHLSGPNASRRLVQFGADVVKIENPRHGDGNRGAVFHGSDFNHLTLNAGTRSVAVEPKSAAWPLVVEAAARWADVVIVGNRPSSARRLGIDLNSMIRHNPQLVYCLVTGYGLAGPWREHAAHGLNMDAMAGVVPVEDHKGRPAAPNDYRTFGTTLAGVEGAAAILAALHRRDRGDGPQFVHISVWESALTWMWRDLATFANTGRPWDAYAEMGPRYSMYRSSDSRIILICPTERQFWERFCDALGLPQSTRDRGDWSQGSDFGRAYPGEWEEVQKYVGLHTLDQLILLLAKADIPAAPILHWTETMSSEHAIANGVMTDYELHGKRIRIATVPASITRIDASRDVTEEELAAAHRHKGDALGPAPELGQHTHEVFSEWGLPDLDIPATTK